MPRKLHSLHSSEFKAQALLKARGRGARSLASVADELNMSFGTLRNWTKTARTPGPQAQTTHPALDGPAASWSSAQRLGALHESYSLGGEALAGWCREHGLFEHQLRQWHDDFCTAGVPAAREAPGAFRELQRELRHKEKVLAEVAALLVMQKNFQALPDLNAVRRTRGLAKHPSCSLLALASTTPVPTSHTPFKPSRT